MEQCVRVAALVIGSFVFLNTVTGSWPARYVTPIKQPVFSANLKTCELQTHDWRCRYFRLSAQIKKSHVFVLRRILPGTRHVRCVLNLRRRITRYTRRAVLILVVWHDVMPRVSNCLLIQSTKQILTYVDGCVSMEYIRPCTFCKSDHCYFVFNLPAFHLFQGSIDCRDNKLGQTHDICWHILNSPQN